MRRSIGVILTLIGLTPIIGLALLYWVWARHMYTIGLSADGRAVMVLAFLAIVDLAILGSGIYLLRRVA